MDAPRRDEFSVSVRGPVAEQLQPVDKDVRDPLRAKFREELEDTIEMVPLVEDFDRASDAKLLDSIPTRVHNGVLQFRVRRQLTFRIAELA